jgi:cell division protein FtsB
VGIAGITRRRVAWIALTVVAAWIVVGFAGQAADGARASTEVEAQRALNARVAAETDALRRELELVTQERWILQQARAYRLGSRKERPYAIAPGAPALPADAPGSAARRLGADRAERTPLDAWLEVLFGPQR